MKRTKKSERKDGYIIRVFDDLLKLLEERPDYLEKLQAIIFTKRLKNLPNEFDEHRKEVNERFDRLEKKVDEAISEAREAKGIAKEAKEMAREAKEKAEDVEKKFDNFLENEFKPFKRKTENDIAKLKGGQLELLFEKKAYGYLGKHIIKCRVIDKNTLAQKVDDAYDKNIIDEDEAIEVMNLDALVSGKLREDKSDVLLAVEISSKVDIYDIERAKRRALIIEKVYNTKTIPVVVGEEIDERIKQEIDGVLYIQVVL